jgi:hypothetical protein
MGAAVPGALQKAAPRRAADARTAHMADCPARVLIPVPCLPAHHMPASGPVSIPLTMTGMAGEETPEAKEIALTPQEMY